MPGIDHEGTVLEEGFPRNDKLFDSDRAEVIQELKDCGVDVKALLQE